MVPLGSCSIAELTGYLAEQYRKSLTKEKRVFQTKTELMPPLPVLFNCPSPGFGITSAMEVPCCHPSSPSPHSRKK